MSRQVLPDGKFAKIEGMIFVLFLNIAKLPPIT